MAWAEWRYRDFRALRAMSGHFDEIYAAQGRPSIFDVQPESKAADPARGRRPFFPRGGRTGPRAKVGLERPLHGRRHADRSLGLGEELPAEARAAAGSG